MDEGLLNDLLECSVCLERLDTSSRVLPCQHTFCLKCLKVIVESHKELRCPECRVLVEARLEELPPNVLLMRILEGMRNAPRKPAPAARHAPPQSQGGAQSARGDPKHLPPHGRALFDYLSKEPGDLNFKKGDMVVLQRRLDPFWYQGECSGRTGMFPITYVQVIVPLPTPTALCKALYDFKMSAPDEEGCLAFDKGAIITVHRRVDENWAEGRLEQRVGIFPIAFVELNQPAKHLINSALLNRPVPPVPGHVRPPRPEVRQHVRQAHQKYQPISVSTAQGNYINVSLMSQSHPNYQPAAPRSLPSCHSVTQHSVTSLITATPLPRNIGHIMEATKQNTDLIQFNAPISSVKKKCDFSATPVSKLDSSQNSFAVTVASFNANSSDSNSSINTPSVVSSSTANSSNTSSESADTGSPVPDNRDEAPPSLMTSNAQNCDSNPVAEQLEQPVAHLSIDNGNLATTTSTMDCPISTESRAKETKDAQRPEKERDGVGPSTSIRSSGPNSLLNFGLNLQAALSTKEGAYHQQRQHHREKEKRHSLTPSTHLQAGQTQNRHSAEILATSLLDHTPERDRDRPAPRERERRRERTPVAYVALYPYTPQKPDELELKKGAMYWVSERCRDGWYKGRAEGGRRAGVFPGNYVKAAPHQVPNPPNSGKVGTQVGTAPAPDAPPRAPSPTGQPLSCHWSSPTQPQTTPRSEKLRDKARADKGTLSSGVSLMRRLAAMKKCKSPPPAVGFSVDNPVFEDAPGTSLAHAPHAVHVRSGSCPSQLLRAPHAERPRTRAPHAAHADTQRSGADWQSQHRKSQSLDVTAAKRERHHAAVNEKFRCVVPYPPSAEYELELKVDDIVIVSKKRGDGWYKGTLQRTGRTGLFPASFVQLCRE